jgi:hypothetical protein
MGVERSEGVSENIVLFEELLAGEVLSGCLLPVEALREKLLSAVRFVHEGICI